MSYQTDPEHYPFFFYGTLRQGQENYTLLRYRTVFEQPARAPSMTLYSLRHYPIMVSGGSYVYGDLMYLRPQYYYELLKELDYLEGYDETNPISGSLRRVLIPLEVETGRQMLGWSYMVSRTALENYPNREKITHGDWSYHKRRALIEKRFGKYDESLYGTPAHEAWEANGQTRQDVDMPQSSIFNWRDGEGWLVLAGRGDFTDSDTNSIISQALSRTISLGPLAHIWAAGDIESADKNLEILADMGSRTGFLIDVITEDNDTLRKQLEEAGIIIIGDGDDVDRLRAGLEGPVMRSIVTAYQNGATILGIGAGATVIGQWMLNNDLEPKPGFAWLKQAIVVLEGHEEPLHLFLREYPNSYGIGLSPGAGVSFSPEGAMEMWGNQQITVSLGKSLTNGE